MQLVIVHIQRDTEAAGNNRLLRFGMSQRPVADMVLQSFRRYPVLAGGSNTTIAVPQEWMNGRLSPPGRVQYYSMNVTLRPWQVKSIKKAQWLAVANGRFSVQIDKNFLGSILAAGCADVVMINGVPEQSAHREKVRLTQDGKVAGIRRLYTDLAEPAPVPGDWPHYVFVKTDIIDNLMPDGVVPGSFPVFCDICRLHQVRLQSLNVAGDVLDLATEDGLLGLLNRPSGFAGRRCSGFHRAFCATDRHRGPKVASTARIIGQVLFDRDVTVGADAIIVGPAIICGKAEIGERAVIKSSIIGPDVAVPPGCIVRNRVLPAPDEKHAPAGFVGTGRTDMARGNATYAPTQRDVEIYSSHSVGQQFRTWPGFSYARCLKRFMDIFVAAVVLILFAPFIPIIALVIKLTSPGTVFFADKRQGLHGRMFNCLKFRTMLVGADKMQEKLRRLNVVDGPQFKMDDDPRVSVMGRFLRETHIDEIPQFINVLFGQMSVVGPRPSPESENTLCPVWRDARLSVRPGITGLWQVCRTRRTMKDFQEWIYYDTKYVRDLSVRTDLWICWKTAIKLIRNFARQF